MSAGENGRTDSLYTYDSFNGGKPVKEGEKSHFLWWCAGAYQPILRECPSEQSKYAGLGGVILATFVLAALSAGYAVYSVFSNPLWAVGFALIWGLVIFNFDRFLVATMRKYGVSRNKQIWMAVPRLVLALLIGFTIARPLELKIFEKEIDVQIVQNRHQKMLLNDSLLAVENRSALSVAQQAKNILVNRKSTIEDTLHQMQQAYVQEADGTGGSLHRGINKLTRLKEEAYLSALQRFSPELQDIGRQTHYQDSIIAGVQAGQEIKRQGYEALVAADIGFLEKNKALSDLSGRESSVFWANLLVSLLIILIEIGPILSKLIMSTGPYDLALARFELLQMAGAEDEIRKDKEMVYDKRKLVYSSKKEITKEMMQQLSSLQKKHIKEELDQWEKGENTIPDRKSLEEMTRQIKTRYDFREEDIL